MASLIGSIIGLSLVIFVPGYLLTRLIFKDLENLEKILLSIGINIVIDILLAFFLGINETMKDITGGITQRNILIYLGSLTFILLFLNVLFKYTKKKY